MYILIYVYTYEYIYIYIIHILSSYLINILYQWYRARRWRMFQNRQPIGHRKRAWLLWLTDGRVNPPINWKLVGVVFPEVVTMVFINFINRPYLENSKNAKPCGPWSAMVEPSTVPKAALVSVPWIKDISVVWPEKKQNWYPKKTRTKYNSKYRFKRKWEKCDYLVKTIGV